MNSAFVGYEELRRSRKLLSTSASVDNILLDLRNSLYPTQPHSLIAHFTVMDGSKTEGDLVLIQTLLLYYVNQVILMLKLLVFFKNNFHNKAKRVCIKTRSPSPSLPSITVKWPIAD